jgi:protoheme IX farnesyltransferase
MNTVASSVPHPGSPAGNAELRFEPQGVSIARLSAYLDLAKPRIALMVLLCAAAGFILGSRGVWQPVLLLHASIGILLAVVSSSTFNQWYERETDARMPRTQDRPLPSSRLSVSEVLIFALLTGTLAVSYLAVTVNSLTAGLAALSIVLYAGCYTPLKRHTTFCTVVGAIPGALPPVLGWTAAGGELNLGAFSLFALLFVWQFPHFLAIAWLYRDQYEQAGLKMVPGRGRPGINGAVAAGYALVLIPISLLPVQLGLTGDLYGVSAMVLGGIYAWTAIRFQRRETRRQARHVIWASLVYLPVVLSVLTLDHLRLIQ